MKNIPFISFSILFILFNSTLICAQDNAQSCKVVTPALVGEYKGDCKKGMASGQGEAKGTDHYIGPFKKGMPNGTGIYYYGDSAYYSGDLQDGIKEGKGEIHYLRKGMADSVVRGYWSGDEYKGKRYITYSSDISMSKFNSVEINPSDESGNTLTINCLTTTGSPDGTPTGASGFVLNVIQLISMNGDNPRILSKNASTLQSSIEFELHKFPAILQIMFSDGQIINLELYKSADWRARFYLNQ